MSRDEAFLAAGRALAQVHRFERNLKGLAALVRAVDVAGRPEAVEIDFSGASLGTLIDHARRLARVDPAFEAALEEARLRRNLLCHAYFHEREADLATEAGLRAMVEELRAWERGFDRVADLTTDLLGRLVAALDARLG